MNGDVTVPVGLTETGRHEAGRLAESLRDEGIELCVTSAFQRAQETADIALEGRDVPRLVLPELNDPLYGDYEGAHLDVFRDWAAAQPSTAVPGPGGESRVAIVDRYVRGFRTILACPEESILVVCHSLPIAYALAAREGRPPASREPLVEYAVAYPFTTAELERAADVLAEWAASPTW
jgi:broad specificity phosphatase PhoE